MLSSNFGVAPGTIISLTPRFKGTLENFLAPLERRRFKCYQISKIRLKNPAPQPENSEYTDDFCIMLGDVFHALCDRPVVDIVNCIYL